MYAISMIAFREGLEALLIVSIMSSYLRASGRPQLAQVAVRSAWLTAALCALLAVALARVGGLSPLAEGLLASFAAVCVISCAAHMLTHGKQMAGQIRSQLGERVGRTGWRAALGVAALSILMVGREGVEAAAMVAALAQAGDMRHMAVGALAGLAAAAGTAWAWSVYGRRVDLSVIFRITTVFMVLFSIQLLVYAFHELTEAGVVPGVDNEWWHIATEPYGPEGTWGAWLTYSLAIVPAAMLVWSGLRRARPNARVSAT